MRSIGYIYRSFLLLFCLVIFYSCEFDSDNVNYVSIEKPKDEIPLGIDLAGVNPQDVIYVYRNSTFSYSLFTDGKDILARQFYLDGEPLDTHQETGQLHFDRDITDGTIHNLKLVIALKTGTGSLAEHAQLEMYVGEFDFKIKMIPFTDNLMIRQTQDNNNHLKLEWNKPTNFEVAGYKIYNGDTVHGELLATIDNPNQTYFVDKDYAYGYKSYTVVAEIKNSFDLAVADHYSVNYFPITDEEFETKRVSTKEISVKWNNPNPFPARYVLSYGYDKKIDVEMGENEVIIPANSFPSWAEAFSLYIIPVTADINQYKKYTRVDGSYRDNSFEAISFCANPHMNILYALNFKKMDKYQLSSMIYAGSLNHNLTLDTGSKIQVSSDGKIAIDDLPGIVHIYANSTFDKKINEFRIGLHPFKLLNNNQLLIEERNGFKLYDVMTKEIIMSKTWESQSATGEILTKTSISHDGHYFYVHCSELDSPLPTKKWIELYELSSANELVLLSTDDNINVQSVQFNPMKNTEIIMQYSPNEENKFVIMDILTNESKEIKGEFMNIDTSTGNLLFKGEEYQDNIYNVYVWDKDYSKEIIKIELANINPFSKAQLYHNTLFFNNSYLNLSTLKEWKQ